MVKKNVEHYSKWKKERISKHKKTTWKKYEKYIETEGGNFSSEIHYYKSHPVKPDKHPTHPDNESDESHNDEIKKRQDEHRSEEHTSEILNQAEQMLLLYQRHKNI